MPRSINCFHAGETSGIPRTAAPFQAIWKHLDLGHGSGRYVSVGGHLEKETASRCDWAKMLLKCKLSLCCAASESAWVQGRDSGCCCGRALGADVPADVHSLRGAVWFVAGESVTLFSLLPAKSFSSSC